MRARIRVTAELNVPKEIRPEFGAELDALRTRVENGREAYIVRVGNPHVVQFAVFPDECEVLTK